MSLSKSKCVIFKQIFTVFKASCFIVLNTDLSQRGVAGYKHPSIGDDISTKSSNVKININNVCNLINHIKRAI